MRGALARWTLGLWLVGGGVVLGSGPVAAQSPVVADAVEAPESTDEATLGSEASTVEPEIPALAPSPRRVLLITVDTLRADHVGAIGGRVETPAMDQLVAEGALLLDAVTPVPTTGPAHASLFTGLYPWRHGTLANAAVLNPELPTVAGRAQAAGFSTAAFVSSYILHPRFGFAQGFDTYGFDPTEAYLWRGKRREAFFSRGETTTAQVLRWLTAHHTESFFVWVHYFDPHAPYLPPPDFALPSNAPVDLTGKLVPRPLRDPADLARTIRHYRGEVRYTDHQVGQLVERMRMLGILDDTTVVLTSDHGEGLGDHGLLAHGENLFDELIRVPLIVRGPGIPAGARRAGAVQLEDLAPTLLEAMGLPLTPDLDGLPLGAWIRGETVTPPRVASFGQRRPALGEGELFFERRAGAKWIGPPGGAGKRFDLEADPREFSGEEGVPMPESLQAALEQQQATDVSPIDLDPEVKPALEPLGYAK